MKSMQKFNINKLSFSRILLLLLGTVIICVFMQNMRSIEGLTTGCSVNPNQGTLYPPSGKYTCPLSNPSCAGCDSRFTQTQCSDYSSYRSSGSNDSNSYCLWNAKIIQNDGGVGGVGGGGGG